MLCVLLLQVGRSGSGVTAFCSVPVTVPVVVRERVYRTARRKNALMARRAAWDDDFRHMDVRVVPIPPVAPGSTSESHVDACVVPKLPVAPGSTPESGLPKLRRSLPSWESLFDDNADDLPTPASFGAPDVAKPRDGARRTDQAGARGFVQTRTESNDAELEEGSRVSVQSRVSLRARGGGGGTLSSVRPRRTQGSRELEAPDATDAFPPRGRTDGSREHPGGAGGSVVGRCKGMVMPTPRSRAAAARHFVFPLQGTIESTGPGVRGPEGSWELVLRTDAPYPQTLKVEGPRATLPATWQRNVSAAVGARVQVED